METEQKRVISHAVNEAFASCGAKPGEKLTAEQIRKLSLVAAQKVTPFFLHRMRGLPPDLVAAIRSGADLNEPLRC
jgi:hypothetical protein